MQRFTIILSFVFLYVFGFSQSHSQLELLDKYYEKSFKEWNIPGGAIAIVSGNEIVFSKGYGFTNIELKTQVDENSLFAVASNTKAFTAAALAQLVDQKKLKWTDKVIDYIPYFKLYDDYVTNHFTIEDLLSHRSGLVTFSGDLLWYGTDKSAEEIIRSARFLEPKYEYRTQFGYSNIMYLVAGQIVSKISGKTWKEYIKTEFIEPLGMDRTILSVKDIKNTNNIATPYFEEKGENNELEWLDWDNIAPAGAIISSVKDFSQWLKLQINEGTLNDKEYFSIRQFNKMTTPHVNFRVNLSQNSNTHFKAYGLGWSLEDYHGVKVLSHGGGYDGMISKSCVVPEKKLGIIVMTNNLNWLSSALVKKTLDVVLANDLDGKDWSADYLKFKKQEDQRLFDEQQEDLAKRGKKRGKSFQNADYIGTYIDKMYGSVEVSIRGNGLFFDMKPTAIFSAPLEHWNNDIFTFRFDTKRVSLPYGKLWFDLDKNGNISKLHIDVPNPDFNFMEFEFVIVK